MNQGNTLDQLLKKQTLYANVVSLKITEIEFFQQQIEQTFSQLDIFNQKKDDPPRQKNLQDFLNVGREISFLASAFYSAASGFLDTLAIYHTKNRLYIYNKIHFKKWVTDLLKQNSNDKYLLFLKNECDTWISDFIFNRNRFIHNYHIFSSTERLFHVKFNEGEQFEPKYFIVNLVEGDRELIPYIKEISNNCEMLIAEVNKNYIQIEYEY